MNTYKHGDGRSATRLYNKNADLFLKGYFCDERRNEKWRLQPSKGRLKICSYHSYKGWESSHIILLFEGIGDDWKWKEEQKNALFIATTRVNALKIVQTLIG
ncbi:hypothetical protein [Metabacillus niabensis]|uniref:hypothetical protein n=1 Tax=Metabacillus niabensis TaxID=324854 RepID=UPI0036736350